MGPDGFAAHVRQLVEALDLAGSLGDDDDAIAAWYSLGNTHYHVTSYENAEEAYRESSVRALDADRPALAAMGLMGLGHTQFVRERPLQARECYGAAMAIFRNLGLLQHEVYALTWLGQACVMGETYGDARTFFEEAISRCDAIDPLYEPTIRGSKAEVLQRMAYLYQLAGRTDLQRKYESEAAQLGATMPPCPHP